MINGFQKSRILITAFELDIFTYLSKGEKSSKEITVVKNIDNEAVEQLLNALCAIEISEKN